MRSCVVENTSDDELFEEGSREDIRLLTQRPRIVTTVAERRFRQITRLVHLGLNIFSYFIRHEGVGTLMLISTIFFSQNSMLSEHSSNGDGHAMALA